MARIRIPKSQLAIFKSFCRAFAKTLESQNGVRLRGNRLLNIVARAAGHESYTALLIDSKTFGDGHLDWPTLPDRLSLPLSKLTGETQSNCQIALDNANSCKASADSPAIQTRPSGPDLHEEDGRSQITIGELYAGRCRPHDLEVMGDYVARHVKLQARIDPFPSDPIRVNDLNRLAKEAHRMIPQDAGIRETDIAGWVIDHGHRIGINCPKQIASTLAPSLRIENSSIRNIDLAFRRSSLEMSSNNLFFHSRGHSASLALANKLVQQNPSIASPELAREVMEVETLNDVLELLSSNPKSATIDEMLSRTIMSHTATNSLVRQFNERDCHQFDLTCGYIRAILTSDSFMHH